MEAAGGTCVLVIPRTSWYKCRGTMGVDPRFPLRNKEGLCDIRKATPLDLQIC